MVESLVAVRDRRDEVISRLSECYASDLLDIDELERRLDLAHAATTIAELGLVIADLAAPPTARFGPDRPAVSGLRVILSSIERRGRWTVARELTARVVFGSAELDFRDASVGPGTTTLDVRVTFGSLELILPPWLAIEVDVVSFAGSVDERHRLAGEPGLARPVLRVTGTVWFGNVEISTRMIGETKRDARRRERSERHQAIRALPPGSG